MARPVRMPPLGTTSDELRIVEWLKEEGDGIVLGEPLLAVETDKATLEVEAATAGTLLKVVHGAGAVVEVGEVLAFVGAPGEEIPLNDEDEKRTASVAGPASPPARTPRVLVSPAVRRLAAERGIDLARVRGSGPEGRIEKHDVLAAAVEPSEDGEVLTRHRVALARRLSRSAAIPQFSVGVTVDMTRARRVLESERSGGLSSLTYTHLLLRAVASGLRAHPRVNALWRDDGPRRVPLEHAHVGLAVADDDALYVVAVPEPDRSSLADLVEDCERAAAEARAGRISERFSAPVAVTLSNLGATGVDRFTAVVDPSQTAILAAGRVEERPGRVGAGLGLVAQLELTLTADHRVIDGLAAGRFLVDVRRTLEDGDVAGHAP